MIYGKENSNFQIHIDKTIESGKWVYGAFNLIINDRFYPGILTNWTLNMIVGWLKSFLNEDLDNYEMLDCENKDVEYLFKEAVISRIGYYYDNPEIEFSLDKYPKKVGVEIEFPEIQDTGLELFFFRGNKRDILAFYFQGDFLKIELEIGYLHQLIDSIPGKKYGFMD